MQFLPGIYGSEAQASHKIVGIGYNLLFMDLLQTMTSEVGKSSTSNQHNPCLLNEFLNKSHQLLLRYCSFSQMLFLTQAFFDKLDKQIERLNF